MKRKKKQVMKPVDMTPFYKKYRGYYLALSDDRKKVLAKGHTAEEALKEAKEKGIKDPLLARIPWENRSYLL